MSESVLKCYSILKLVFKIQSKQKRAQRNYNFPWQTHSKTQDTEAMWLISFPLLPFLFFFFLNMLSYTSQIFSASLSLEHLGTIMPTKSILLAPGRKTWIPALIFPGCITLLLLYSNSSSKEQKPGRNPLFFICLPTPHCSQEPSSTRKDR